jgi:hypothetical protein
VLFSVRTERRERGVRELLVGSGVPVATAARQAGQPPHEAIWTPLGSRNLLRLTDLAMK